MKEIIIASSSIDSPTYQPVLEKLKQKGFGVFLYLADMVASGQDSFAVTTSVGGELNFSYNEVIIAPDQFVAGWYRHPNLLNLDYEDKARQLCVEDEIISLQDVWWQSISEDRWLNSPEKNRKAQSKITQLAVASSLGFIIPKTIVSNSWDRINEHLQEDEIIMKMKRGLLYADGETKVLYASRLNTAQREAIRNSSPFPAIFQSFVEKNREWRVTIVGDNVFEASIYTEDGAKDDWRKHQLTDKVSFRKERFYDDIKEKCFRFLGHYGLRYGAFDFVEDHDGKVTFLECNPNGQYKWLEDLLGIPITSCIADEIVNIAKK